MFKKAGLMALVLMAGGLFVKPTAASAQERYDHGRYSYGDSRGYGFRDDGYYRNERREWRNDERRARELREREWREHERWERREYRRGYYAPGYYGNYYYGNGWGWR